MFLARASAMCQPAVAEGFPGAWSDSWELVVDADLVHGSGTHTQFPVLIREYQIPASLWTTARSDGGDIRFSADANGAVPLNREIVQFDATNHLAEIWVARDLSTSTDTSLWIWAGAADETEPTATDGDHGAYGVWDSSYRPVYHLAGTADATGNGHTLTLQGSPSANTNYLGSGYALNGTDQHLEAANHAAFDLTTGITLEAVVYGNKTFTTGNPLIDRFYDNSTRAYYLWTTSYTTINFVLGTANGSGSTALAANDLAMVLGWPKLFAAHWDQTADTMRAMYASGGQSRWSYGVHIGPATPYASNPILAGGSSGAWDEYGVRDPDILRNKTDNLEATDSDGNYVLHYRGYSAAETFRRQGRATRGADWKTWTKDAANNPILGHGTAGAWDESGLAGMSAVKLAADSYVAVYMGFRNSDNTWGVGRATSSNGKTWTKDTAAGRVLTNTSFAGAQTGTTAAGVPYIFYEGNRMYFFCEAYPSAYAGFAIFSAYSDDDGVTWAVANSGNPVLQRDTSLTFADESVANPSVYKIGTNKYLMMCNAAGLDNNYRLCVARSTDLTTWEFYPGYVLSYGTETGNWNYRIESWRPIPSKLGNVFDPIEFIYFGNDINSGTNGVQIGHGQINHTANWTLSSVTASKTDNIGTNNLALFIGQDYNNIDHSAWVFDEVRISAIARSTDWLRTQAENLFDPRFVRPSS